MLSKAVVLGSLLILAGGGAGIAAQGPSTEEAMAGKVRTDRTVEVERIVEAPPAAVYDLWTTPEGVKRFFAPDAKIEPRVGGAYEILFAPAQDPLGYSHGTTGARVLRIVPGRELAFE